MLPEAKTRIVAKKCMEESLVLQRARLRVEVGPDAGKELLIEHGAARIGTSIESDLVLTDDAVSAFHCELVATELGYLLRDLNSTNGTFVHGCRLGQLTLSESVQIAVGSSLLRFARLGGDVSIPISSRDRFGGLLGTSPQMRAVFSSLEKAATAESTVLVMGESGTGKELAGRALHDASSRRDGPFIVFDCGAVAPTLLDSQLFGHVRGAFTGADDDKPGALEEAHEGTLVLDEIGELPLELQPKLLRALETKSFTRVGENTPRVVDVRFVASTNRNLEEEIRLGRFRRDLFYRLSVISVRLPPLRDRKEELSLLIGHFFQMFTGTEAQIPDGLIKALHGHEWPGNVRELRNFVERYITLPDMTPSFLDVVETGAESIDILGIDVPTDLPFHDAKAYWLDIFEKHYMKSMLDVLDGNMSAIARKAKISRQSCYNLVKKHGLEP